MAGYASAPARGILFRSISDLSRFARRLCLYHGTAQRFLDYPAEFLAADPGLVAAITINMSTALTPSAPREQFAALDRPFGLWIGSEDELFLPERVLAFVDLAVPVRADSQVSSLPGARHLSVLVRAHETIGPGIARMVQEKKGLKANRPLTPDVPPTFPTAWVGHRSLRVAAGGGWRGR